MSTLYVMQKKKKGCGLSHISARHLFLACSQSKEFKTALVIVVNGIVDGSILGDERVALLALVRGIALCKPGPTDNPGRTGIRPIACCETITTLIAKLLIPGIRDDVIQALDQFDMGFGKQSGCEAIIHSIQALFLEHRKTNKEFVLLQTDLKNAFGACLQSSLIEVARRIRPSIVPFL